MADKDKEAAITGLPRPNRDAEEIHRYERILARESSSLVFAALAEAYRRRNMLDQAISVCRKGLHHHPDFVSGRVALARAYVDSGQTDRAERELERAILIAPDNLIAQRLLLTIYRGKGDLDNLEKTIHRILSSDPKDEQARKAWEWLQARRSDESSKREEGSSREIVTQTLAEIYASQGYHEKAFEIYRKLSIREPENPHFHERLADLKPKVVHRYARSRGREEANESYSE